MNPKIYFRNFLENAEDRGWVASYKWTVADTYQEMKSKLAPADYLKGSRSHKKGFEAKWWAIDVEAHEGTNIGIDLEILADRRILRKPQWLINRFHLEVSAEPKKVVEEWSKRESVFKALAPDNEKLTLQQIRRTGPDRYTAFINGKDINVQTKSHWSEYWFISMAWRSLEI